MNSSGAVYVDTSALIPLAVSEVHSAWAKQVLDDKDLVSSVIAKVELARVPKRTEEFGAQILGLAAKLNLVGLNSDVVEFAGAIPGFLKALDAIHLGTWLLLRSREFHCDFVTADRQLARAATTVGATVIHPFGSEL